MTSRMKGTEESLPTVLAKKQKYQLFIEVHRRQALQLVAYVFRPDFVFQKSRMLSMMFTHEKNHTHP